MDGLTYQLIPNTDPTGMVINSDKTIEDNRPDPLIRISGGNMLGGADPNVVFDGEDNGGMTPPETGLFPEKVRVTFPKYKVPGGGAHTSWLGSRPGSHWILDSYNEVWSEIISLSDVFPGIGVRGVIGVQKLMHDTAKAVYVTGMEAMPTNQMQLHDLALQLATNFYDEMQEGLDETYPGILSWDPEGVHDVIWSFRADKTTTRVIPKAWNYGVTEFQHGFNVAVDEQEGGGGTFTLLFSVANGSLASPVPPNTSTPLVWRGDPQIFFMPTDPVLQLSDRFTIPNSQPQDGKYLLIGSAWFTFPTQCLTNYSGRWVKNGLIVAPTYTDTGGVPSLGPTKVEESTWMKLSPGDFVQFMVYFHPFFGMVGGDAAGDSIIIIYLGI
jgi:hypothetical protein